MNKQDFGVFLLDKGSNGAIQQTVAQTPNAIGYVGLGFVDSTVQALPIDNVTPTVDHILDGTYPIARELYLFTKGNGSSLAQEFIAFVLSPEGQGIVEEEGFVPLKDQPAYNATGKTLSGTVRVSGSTTVLPIVSQAGTRFMELYAGVTVTVSGGGSGTGITSVGAGTVDIGMSSRTLKESEANLGLVGYSIASDGIAIIVHPDNAYTSGLSLETVKAIYAGEIKDWREVS